MAQFNSGGLKLAYDDIGARNRDRPIILIHGFASNRNENWRRLGWYGALERRGTRFVALDCRGHGESSKPHDPSEYSAGKMIDDLFALMDHLGVSRADLLGFSMGARLALAAAMTKPERVGDLILGGLGGRLFDPPPSGAPIAEAMEAPSIDAIGNPLLKGFRQFAEEQGEDRIALAACARARAAALQPESLSGFNVRTLVVAGAHDELAGDPQELAGYMPNARAVTLPGCNHFSAIAHALFKASVFDFLDGEMI